MLLNFNTSRRNEKQVQFELEVAVTGSVFASCHFLFLVNSLQVKPGTFRRNTRGVPVSIDLHFGLPSFSSGPKRPPSASAMVTLFTAHLAPFHDRRVENQARV